MPTFALITEGLTDQLVIERLIEQVCDSKFDDDIEVNPLQPVRDSSDAHFAPHAGWELVFEFCRLRTEEALATNDYLVIQVDTDEADHENFGVPLTDGGADRPIAEIISDVEAKMVGLIRDGGYTGPTNRIIFATAVHSTESWLLLILFDKDKKKSSFDHLRRELQRRDDEGLQKTFQCYDNLARQIKYKRLKVLHGSQESLGIFIRRLASV